MSRAGASGAMRGPDHDRRPLQRALAFARENWAWWLVPPTLVALIVAVLALSGRIRAPFTYTLF